MKIKLFLLGLILIGVLAGGCISQTQDEAFKTLVQNVTADFQGQSDMISRPNQGVPVAELYQYKNAASSAKNAAEAMTLSDSAGKARGLFVTAMNATISAVDTLEQEGKLTNPEEKVTIESVSINFVTTQTKLDDTARMLKIEKPKNT